MSEIQIKSQTLASRCEVCHLDDQFDAVNNYCARCAPITATVDGKPFDKYAGYRGVKGWLGFLAVMLVSIYPLISGFNLIMVLYAAVQISTQLPTIFLWAILKAVIEVSMAVFSIVAGIGLMTKSTRAIPRVRNFLLASLLSSLICAGGNIAFFGTTFGEYSINNVIIASISNVITMFVFVSGVALYLRFSDRVKATFGEQHLVQLPADASDESDDYNMFGLNQRSSLSQSINQKPENNLKVGEQVETLPTPAENFRHRANEKNQAEVDRLLRRGIFFSVVWLMGIGSGISLYYAWKAKRLIDAASGELIGTGRVLWCVLAGGGGLLFWGFIILRILIEVMTFSSVG